MANTRRTPVHAIEYYLRDFAGNVSLGELAKNYDLPRNTLYRNVRENASLKSIPLWELETLAKVGTDNLKHRKGFSLDTVVGILKEYDRLATPILKDYYTTGHYATLPQQELADTKRIKLVAQK